MSSSDDDDEDSEEELSESESGWSSKFTGGHGESGIKKDHERGSSLMPKCSEGIGGPAPRNNGVEGFHPVCNLAIIAICKTTYHHVNIEKWNLVVYGGLAAQSKTDPTPTDLQWQLNRFSNRGL